MKNLIGINKEKASHLNEQLNDLLANYQLFYQNLRAFHWNISGERFFELHEKYEEMYEGANEAVDYIAERILTLGGRPLHAFSDYMKKAEIEETVNVSDARQSVKVVLNNMSVLLEKERKVLALAGEADDEGTAALISDFIKEQEKLVWMLNAYLK